MKRTALLCACMFTAALAAGASSAQTSTPAPAPESQAAAAAPPAPAPPPAPPPPAPTGEAAYLVSILDKVCLPLVTGGDEKAVTKAQGLKKTRDGWLLKLDAVQSITVAPRSTTNPAICSLTLTLAVDQHQPLLDALAGWAAARTPPLLPVDQGYKAAGFTSWSWTGDTAAGHQGLVFNLQKTADGQPLGKGYDVAGVLYADRGQ